MELLDLFLMGVSTAAFYFLANYHTYNLGVAAEYQKPLEDFFHDVLPNMSNYIKWRDYILVVCVIPLFFMPFKTACEVLYYFVEGFIYVVTLKAITIFFTQLPSSNQRCAKEKQMNHCFHQMFSGHNSFVTMLCILYCKNIKQANARIAMISFMVMYSFFILMTRAHYTVDVLVSYIIVWLLFN